MSRGQGRGAITLRRDRDLVTDISLWLGGLGPDRLDFDGAVLRLDEPLVVPAPDRIALGPRRMMNVTLEAGPEFPNGAPLLDLGALKGLRGFALRNVRLRAAQRANGLALPDGARSIQLEGLRIHAPLNWGIKTGAKGQGLTLQECHILGAGDAGTGLVSAWRAVTLNGCNFDGLTTGARLSGDGVHLCSCRFTTTQWAVALTGPGCGPDTSLTDCHFSGGGVSAVQRPDIQNCLWRPSRPQASFLTVTPLPLNRPHVKALFRQTARHAAKVPTNPALIPALA